MLTRALLASVRNCSRRPFSQSASGLPLRDSESAADLPSEPRAISEKINSLVEEIANLSLFEVSDLNYALKKRLNIPEAPMMMPGMMMSAAQPAAQPSASADEPDAESSAPQKITFAVKLAKFDDTKKIALIKEIRNVVPGLNLVQAKKFVETAPCMVKEDMGKAEAEELKKLLENSGGICEIV